jgi:putative ABC transport system ATP-binding protein
MGASGSGKTTLLNMISTVGYILDGTIKIDGTDIIQMKPDSLADFRAQKLEFIFQDFNLLENLSLYENIAILWSLQGVAFRKIKFQVHHVANILAITSILNKYHAEISGGKNRELLQLELRFMILLLF